MTTVNDIVRAAPATICRPGLRYILNHDQWTALAQAASAEGQVLVAHWADTAQVHALFLDQQSLTLVVASTQVEEAFYPALSPFLPAAAWYERMIADLWGHSAGGAVDLRPWLDHGRWTLSRPMSSRPGPPTEPEIPNDPEQDDLMVLPLGPIWGQLDEAAHLRLTLNGPTVVRAESRLGFTHKGTLSLMRGKSPRAAARFVARLSADATVAHSVAFAQATEAAMDVRAPARAATLRIVMMEIERIAGHLDNLTEIGRLADAPKVRTSCGFLRETLLRASDSAFGHRLMMDCVVPGGVATDIAVGGATVILRALGDIASHLPMVRDLHDAPSMSSRLAGVGRVGRNLATRLGVGGVVGRASGYAFDARSVFVADYHQLAPRIAMRPDGDAAARQHLRIFEIEESLRLIGAALDSLADGPFSVALPPVSGEGMACTESVRGDVWHWLVLDHGQIATVFARDPGWALWPLAEQMLENAATEDIDLIRASLSLPASGMDL
jgi:Ni,Fe-hydrogenase III large subunit